METAKGELVPGGLALVYGLVNYAELNGMVVITVSIGAHGEKTPAGGRYIGTDGWLCTHDNLDGGFAYIRPRNLMPIKPSADPLHTEEKQCQSA